MLVFNVLQEIIQEQPICILTPMRDNSDEFFNFSDFLWPLKWHLPKNKKRLILKNQALHITLYSNFGAQNKTRTCTP